MIVPDVRSFAGHISCDARSRSEIVVPVFDHRGELIAVLDLDSADAGTFDEVDKRELESWVLRFAEIRHSPETARRMTLWLQNVERTRGAGPRI